MKVKIKLYGTLRQLFPRYSLSQGIEVDIPVGASVKDLLALLEIPESRAAVVLAEGRILKAEDKIRQGVSVDVLQVIRGG